MAVPNPTSLQLLATRISAHADAIAAYNTEHGYPQRSLAPSPAVPARLLPADAPPKLRSEHIALLDAVAEVQLLATDASEFLPNQGARHNQFACLRWLCHFRIPEALPLPAADDATAVADTTAAGTTATIEGLDSYPALSYAVVAAAAGVPEHQLRSIARMGMLLGFLAEPMADHLSHSPLSAAVVASPALANWARFLTSTSAPMAPAMVEATARWGDDRSTNHTAYAAAWDTDLPLFAHVASEPSLQASYAGYMRAMTQSEGLALSHLLDGYGAGWARAARDGAVVVDVGGSSGNTGATLARAHTGLRVVVQDRAEVVARATAEESPRLAAEGLQIAFQAHDFFMPQPERPAGFEPSGKGDVYLMRMILHDWGDEESTTILRHLVPVLRASGKDARLVIMDTVLPRPGEASRTEEALLRVRDLTMLQAHNAHERAKEEWEKLFRRVDPGLVLKEVVQPFKSLMAVLEVAYNPVVEVANDPTEEVRPAKRVKVDDKSTE